MQKRIRLNECKDQVGKEVHLQAFVDKVRDQKHVQFIILRDRTGYVQIVNEKNDSNSEITEQLAKLTNDSVIDLTGTVIENKAVKLGGIEVIVNTIHSINYAENLLPVEKDSSLDVRMDWRYINLRWPETRLIFEVQTHVERAMREYFTQENFIEIHSPKLMGTASESGAELFGLDYFKEQAYLAQSPQFYKQMAMAAGFEKVFEIGPVFRANPSFTTRHDTEFTSIDIELSWVDSHEDVMTFEEKWLQFILTNVKEKFGEKIKEFYGTEVVVPEVPFPRLSLEEAREILKEAGHTISHKADLDPEGERRISAHIKKNYQHGFVFITEYPYSVRPFYHMKNDANPNLTKSYDLIWKGIEITTGAQREHRKDILTEQAKEKRVDTKVIEDYLNFFQYGCPPHGGYGFGLSRMLMLIFNLSNVREATYLYRGPNRLRP